MTAANPKLQGLQAALVDLDGTLVDTLGDFAVAMQRMLDELPAPYCNHVTSPAEASLLVGRGSENLVNSLLARIEKAYAANGGTEGLPSVDRPAALASYLSHYREANGRHSTVYPGAIEGLEALRSRGLRMACVTNKPTEFAQALLAQLGLNHYFVFVLGGDATPLKKPHPMPLLVACERLGVATAHTLMVGDSGNDAAAARAAGCPVVLVPYGYNHGEDVSAVDCDVLMQSLADLQKILA